MSRAAALAYLPLEAEPHSRHSTSTREWRVLGAGALPGQTRRPTLVYSAPGAPYELIDDPYLDERLPTEARGLGMARLRPVVLGLLGVLALALLLYAVTPVFAAQSSQAGGLRLSAYTEPARENAALPFDAPVVDVSTVPSQEGAPPAAQPAPPPPAAPPHPYEVTSPPSISVGQIERVLQQYNSPAAGKGQTLYDLGVRYGIDPAYALAFFVHESACGTKGVARFTQSLGNIRWTEGYVDYEGYRKYDTWESGMEDWYKLISDLYVNGWGLRTVDAIIPVYAPWGDNNDPPTYIASVKRMVDSWRGK